MTLQSLPVGDLRVLNAVVGDLTEPLALNRLRLRVVLAMQPAPRLSSIIIGHRFNDLLGLLVAHELFHVAEDKPEIVIA